MRIVLLITFVGWATGQNDGDLRLAQGGISNSSHTRGRLELYSSGKWGTVCDDHWSSAETRVACRQLGLPTTSTSWTTSSAGGYGSVVAGTIWLVNVRCSGSEARLISCPANVFQSHNCSHSDDVAIDCSSDGDLRLVQNGISSSSNTRGRLEVYYSGRWGTVCDNSWSSANTRVACRQLGLPTTSTSWTTSSAGGYGSVTGTIWLDDVKCSGSESRLISCLANVLGSHNCRHSEDVAIECRDTLGIDVWIVVGVSIASLILFVIIPTICILIVCIMRKRRTAHAAGTRSSPQENMYAQQQTAKQHNAQQFDVKAYPAAGTDLKQAPPPAYEKHTAYPAPSQKHLSSQKQAEQAPPPAYEMRPPPSLATSSRQQTEPAPSPACEIQATPPPPSLITSSKHQQTKQAQPPAYEIQATPPSPSLTTTTVSTEV